MLKDYRDWLESELKLLGNASHHAYSFGQANMAKRALERLDELLAGKVPLLLDEVQARAVLTETTALAPDHAGAHPALHALAAELTAALSERRDTL